MNTATRETDRTGTRRAPGAPLDPETRIRLRQYVGRVHWRSACAAIEVGPAVLRRALKGERIRSASATQIRLALALTQIGGTP